MSSSRSVCSGHRVLVSLLIVVALLVYFYTFEGNFVTMAPQQEERESPITGLKVSLEQTSTSSPPTIRAILTNTNTGPVSILTYDSPLDGAALQLGLLTITPSGSNKPLEIAQIALRRIWPPTLDSIVTIPPGESASNEIEFKPIVVPPEDLGISANVILEGKWQAVWPMKKEDISGPSLDDPAGSPDAFSGTFESNELKITVDQASRH